MLVENVVSTGHPNYHISASSEYFRNNIRFSPDLILNNDTLMTFKNKELFSAYLNNTFKNTVQTNNVPNCTYALSPSFPENEVGGIGFKYGNATTTVTGSTTTTTWTAPILFELSGMVALRKINFKFRYANTENKMALFELGFKTARKRYSLIYVEDEHYPVGSGWRIYTNNRTKIYKTFTSGAQHVDMSLNDEDINSVIPQDDRIGSLFLVSANTINGYTTNYVYIKELEVLM